MKVRAACHVILFSNPLFRCFELLFLFMTDLAGKAKFAFKPIDTPFGGGLVSYDVLVFRNVP